MPDPVLIAAAVVAGYVCGALPFAYWVARSRGADIFRVGSGNPGATNVRRALGKRAGNAVFVLDFLKGLVAALWPRFAAGDESTALVAAIAGLAAAVLGHSCSVFLKFRGGKGVATTMGGLAAIMPIVLAIGIAVWVVAFVLFRYVSLASLLFAASLPVSVQIVSREAGSLLFYFSLAVAVLIFYRHRSNIQSLLAGKENRFGKDRSESADEKNNENG